jgi:hypothetical protein
LSLVYAPCGRPSIRPERLLKASLLISLYSVRTERRFVDEVLRQADGLGSVE